MSAPSPSERTRVRRLPARARYEREAIFAVLDEGLVAHVGVATDDGPFVLPMVYGHDGERLFLHGSPQSRLLRAIAGGAPLCVEVTLVDGRWVLARSTFHHSLNYRSVVVLGRGRALEEPGDKLEALRCVVEHVVPGRWSEARRPDARELAATLVISVPLAEASAKLRTGPPADDEADRALPVWAGVVPLGLAVGAPEPAPDLARDVPSPDSIARYARPASR